MNRAFELVHLKKAPAPRARGDEPVPFLSVASELGLLPAHVGMNRFRRLLLRQIHPAPRARGDEP